MIPIRPFLFLALLFLGFSQVSFAADPVLDAHKSKLQGAKEYTLEVAHAMPEELYSYTPTADEMSFGEQLVHLADNLTWLSSTFLSENPLDRTEKPKAATMSKAEIIQLVSDAYDFAINQIDAQNPELLGKEFDWRGGKMNKIQFLNLIQDHQTHHRAQVIVYLRLNQIKPPAYRGW
jgi:uncharacterized damage-inducible protein DinB